jgi:phenylacetic acid degradation operon negative regulatory protein
MDMARLDYAEMLDLFCWGLDKLSRPTLANLLAGYEEYEHGRGASLAIWRLERERLIQRTRAGKRIEFAITATGQQRLPVCEPQRHWSRVWDGAWRVVTFDLPETQRKERKQLWRALRARKLGLLQRSVWVWPHDVRAMLAEIIRIEGLPECFCGFQASQLFLCTHAEVVATAWDWEEIGRRHQHYLQRLTGTEMQLHNAAALSDVAMAARHERQAYQYAFSFDPLLPRALLPRSYAGFRVENQHQVFRRHLGRRFWELAAN